MVQAIILCAGAGSRLGNLTSNTPKPMIIFNGKPFLQYILEYYYFQKISKIIIAVGYHGEQIKEYFEDGSRFNLSITYAQSSVEVETGGSFKRSLSSIKDDYFFVQFGDVFFPLDYSQLLNKFIKSGKKAMIVACKRKNIQEHEDENDLLIENNLVIEYSRKNISGKCNMLNGGILLLKKEIAQQELKFPDKFKLEEILFPQLIAKKELIAFITRKIPFDIGNLQKIKSFKKIQMNFLAV